MINKERRKRGLPISFMRSDSNLMEIFRLLAQQEIKVQTTIGVQGEVVVPSLRAMNHSITKLGNC